MKKFYISALAISLLALSNAYGDLSKNRQHRLRDTKCHTQKIQCKYTDEKQNLHAYHFKVFANGRVKDASVSNHLFHADYSLCYRKDSTYGNTGALKFAFDPSEKTHILCQWNPIDDPNIIGVPITGTCDIKIKKGKITHTECITYYK